MKTKTLSLSTFLAFLGLVIMIHALDAQAATKNVFCSTAFNEKSFIIEGNKISFQKEDEEGVSRSISSVSADAVRTQIKNQGFVKTLYINGHKHKINIHNQDEFSQINDYLSVTGPQGHEMTYPLTCQSV
jgi:hypothetical protein